MAHVDLTIRRAFSLDDYAACIELQKRVWGFREMEDLTGQAVLMLANRFGGSLLIAEHSADGAIGFAFAMPAWRADRQLFWWSHMTAVAPEHQGQGTGLRLKLAQREDALRNGIERVEWTFDPLQAMNAHFNICKLGAVISEYEENVYGFTSSPLHGGLPTDRFVAVWRLNSERVLERIGDENPGVILRDIESISRIDTAGAAANAPNLSLKDDLLAMEIPEDANELKAADIEKAKAWQDRVRRASQHYFHAGYTITDFIRTRQPARQGLYILERLNRGR